MLTREILTKLRELLAAATPGPWEMDTPPSCADQIIGPNGEWIADVQPYDGDNDAHEPALSNATLIVALRNEMPRLLEELDVLRKNAKGRQCIICKRLVLPRVPRLCHECAQ